MFFSSSFFSPFFSFSIVSSRRHQLANGPRRNREADVSRKCWRLGPVSGAASLITWTTAIKTPLKMYGENCNLRTLSREYYCLANIGTLGSVHVVPGKLRRSATTESVKGQDYSPTRNTESKTKNKLKNHLLLRILTVIGIFGPHLTIVMTVYLWPRITRAWNCGTVQEFPTVSVSGVLPWLSVLSCC